MPFTCCGNKYANGAKLMTVNIIGATTLMRFYIG